MQISLWNLHHNLACVCRTAWLNTKINLGYILLYKIRYILSFTCMSLQSVCYQTFVITSQKCWWCRRRTMRWCWCWCWWTWWRKEKNKKWVEGEEVVFVISLCTYASTVINNNLLLSSSSSWLSPICRLFTIVYLKQTMLLGYIIL